MDGVFRAEVVHLDGDAVLMVVGEVDASTSPVLHRNCVDAALTTDRLVLDFAGVTFMDCSGLHVLIDICQRGDITSVVVRNPAGQVRRLLEIADMADTFLEPHESQTEVAHVTEAGTRHAGAN